VQYAKKKAQSCKTAAKIKTNTPGVTRVQELAIISMVVGFEMDELQVFLIKFTKTSFPSPPTPVVSQAATMDSARGRQSSEQALSLSIIIGADLSAVAFIPHDV